MAIAFKGRLLIAEFAVANRQLMGACKEANGRLIESALILFPQTLGNLHREHWFGLYPVLVAVAIVADFGIDVDSP
jgi:hypothetical protein